MKNDPIEGRVRDALAAQAETISASPDAWQHIQAKGARLSRQQHGRAGPLRVGWLARRSVRKRAVLSAATAAVAAAVTAATLTVGSAPPALATVTTALTRTLTQSYHLTEQNSYYTQYIQNGRIYGRAHDTCTSEADPVRHLEASSCSYGSSGTRDRQVGGYWYRYSSDPVGGKHWERTPVSPDPSLPNGFVIDGFIRDTPQQMLSQIKKADKVTVIGPVSGPRWTGTRYAFTSRPKPTWIMVNGIVDVDRQGQARTVVLTTRLTGGMNMDVMMQSLTFSDFGVPVTVTPPPADQTFTLP